VAYLLRFMPPLPVPEQLCANHSAIAAMTP
jgi:hypothetical protein